MEDSSWRLTGARVPLTPVLFSALATWAPIGSRRIIRERPVRRGRRGVCTSIRHRLLGVYLLLRQAHHKLMQPCNHDLNRSRNHCRHSHSCRKRWLLRVVWCGATCMLMLHLLRMVSHTFSIRLVPVLDLSSAEHWLRVLAGGITTFYRR